jgi:hypothetical protein
MRIQHISSLAFRLLAVYVGFVAIQYISMTARMSSPAMRNATQSRLPPWPNFAVPAALYIVGGLLLFWYSIRLAPKSTDEEEGALEFHQIKSLAFTVLGTYFLINYAPLVASDVLATVSNAFNRTPRLDQWITDVGSSLAGIFLIVANAPKREGVPGFDEMRSDLKRWT